MGAWSGGIFHYKKGMAYKTTADSANTLLNDVFCYFVHHLPKLQNMHPYMIEADMDIAKHVATTYPALPGSGCPSDLPFIRRLERSVQDEQAYAIVGRGAWGARGPTWRPARAEASLPSRKGGGGAGFDVVHVMGVLK